MYISETCILSATSMIADVLYCVINEMAGASCNSQRLNVWKDASFSLWYGCTSSLFQYLDCSATRADRPQWQTCNIGKVTGYFTALWDSCGPSDRGVARSQPKACLWRLVLQKCHKTFLLSCLVLLILDLGLCKYHLSLKNLCVSWHRNAHAAVGAGFASVHLRHVLLCLIMVSQVWLTN
jgi:hypothetical protein